MADRKAEMWHDKLGSRPLIMGILNATPDSFSDGGRHLGVERACAQAERLLAEGCDILDVGGESTRPGFVPVSLEEERARVVPVLRALAGRVALSIDTTKAALAREAISLGVEIVNDVWGLQGDPTMAEVVAEGGAHCIVMHNRHEIDPGCDILDDMRRFFDESLRRAEDAGIPRTRLMLDPGIGFGKTFEQNLSALRRLGDLWVYGVPVLLGVSRKSMLGTITGAPVEDRLPETLAAGMAGLAAGADILRVHDVAAHVAMLRVRAAIEGAA